MNSRTSGSLVVAAIALLACGGQAPAAQHAEPVHPQPPPAPMPEVSQLRAFTGPDGILIEAVDFGDGTALLSVHGADSDITGKILRYERKQDGGDLRYQTQWTGRSWNVLVRRSDRYRPEPSWTAYLPRLGEVHLAYDEEKSQTIDAPALYAAHLEQDRRGDLAPLQRFDRAAEEARHNEAFGEDRARTEKDCGATFAAEIVWPTVGDGALLDKSVSGFCDSVLSGLRSACGYPAGKAFVAKHIQRVRCRLDRPEPEQAGALSLSDGVLDWAIHFELTNLDQAAFAALKALTPAGAPRSLGSDIERDRTVVCADAEKAHVVIVGPNEASHGGMAYGDGQTFYRVPQAKWLSAGWFFDPRQFNEKHNDNFRGYDLRYYSYLEADPEQPEGPCQLRCGTRDTSLTRITGSDKHAMLDRAEYKPSPHDREPYALARDRRGHYYYVDRGASEDTSKDFRLYRGPRGRLKKLAMRDVVSDSEGEIFASDDGKLRLIVGKEDAEWITKKRAQKLQRLPLSDNYGLIYNELGVYLGAQLFVPCDDF